LSNFVNKLSALYSLHHGRQTRTVMNSFTYLPLWRLKFTQIYLKIHFHTAQWTLSLSFTN